MNRRVVRLVARTLAVLATSLGASLLSSTPALAAACTTPTGVTVVVDPHGLGGAVEVRCLPRGVGGKDAATDFTRAGFDLSYVQRQPGFVCRVDGAPSNDPCVNTPPADAYWSLWWTDGTTGRWSYSSLGVGSLTVPAGGFVALSWQGGGGKAVPRAPAAAPGSSPTPTTSGSPSTPPAPTASATPDPATPATPVTHPTTSAPTPSPTERASASRASRKSHHHASATTSASSATPSSSASATASPRPSRRASSESSGLPGWVAPVVVVVLFAAAAAVTVVRRRRGGA